MTVSNAPTSLLDSVLTAQSTRQEIGVTVAKEAQDTIKQQGEAVVQLLEQAAVSPAAMVNSGLDVYA